MISIVLTTYNGSKYLHNQIESLLYQTNAFDELIICDDNSKDDTKLILEKYTQTDRRIKIFFNATNIGFKANFEKALLLSKGDFIALCDQDDIWEPDHLKLLCSNIHDKYVACGDSHLIDSAGISRNMNLSDAKHFFYSDNCDQLFRFITLYQNPFQGASMLLKRDFLSIALPIPDNIKYHDVWFAALACVLNSFVYVPKVVTNYRIHGNNASGSHEKTNMLKTILGHLVRGHAPDSNRKELVDELSKRLTLQGIDCPKVFSDVLDYYLNEDSLNGRMRNLMYEITNYHSIYG